MGWIDEKNIKCPICEEKVVWSNLVNTTNGSFDEKGKRKDGYIKLKIKLKKSGICSACGKEHICETKYYIPKKKWKKIILPIY